MAVFVRARRHRCEPWGVGKATEIGRREATVAWFDSPLSERRTETVPLERLEKVILERQTRVYWLDPAAGVWRVGRVRDADDIAAEVRFPNGTDLVLPVDALEVRWDRPIEEPSAFLAEQISESPAFSEARTQFARTLVDQRGACAGMSGLISSAIELEPHQVEVVRRVLQDPVQRYLLADEVGLGKTIEAGVLIRQYVLDDPHNHRVLVLVPPALAVQWRRELRTRFLLGHLFDQSVRVLPLGTAADTLLEALRWAEMVVIDEAHHLSRSPELYSALREAVAAAPRLLLLSATPVLHNERGFLEMLHLLDPHVFPLDSEEAFRRRIEHRQSLAESVAGLVPENLLRIEDFLDELGTSFPDDERLRALMDPLRELVQTFPDESDPALTEALAALRAHIAETYRLDRRILRNRRRDLPFLTPPRAGLTRVDYSSSATGRLVNALEEWRSAAAESFYGREESGEARALGQWFRDLVEALLVDPASIATLAKGRARSLGAERERRLLDDLAQAAGACDGDRDRLEALLQAVRTELEGSAKLVVFCSRQAVADAVTAFLSQALTVPVDRHALPPADEDADLEQPWERFLSAPDHRVLVCDPAAEEGLNLHGGHKVVIHFDLPFAPNRIEQRLGRADRYGSGEEIRSIALCCSDDAYFEAWLGFLETGLGLFNRSVASLQYLIDDEMRALTRTLLFEGTDSLQALTDRTSGEHGTTARELRRIEDQDRLDALTLPEDSGGDRLSEVDSNWRGIADSVQRWLTGILNVGTEPAPPGPEWFGFGPFRFCFSYGQGGRDTLIPLRRILSALLGVLDPEAPGAGPHRLKTCWYSCRRQTLRSASAPPEGMRLVRWGEDLVERIQHLMDLDDRGRSAALWRSVRGHAPLSDAPADIYLRFDFIVETDINRVLAAAGEADGLALRKALARRGDMALAPFYHTVWIDEGLSLVTDRALLDLLEAPYQRETGDFPYRDWNLNPQRWPIVASLGLPAVDAWRQWVPQARAAAEVILRRESGLEELCDQAIERARVIDQGRFAQLRARLQVATGADAEATAALLAREERIANGLYEGIRAPRVTLGTVVAVFLSAHPLAIDQIAGGTHHG